MSHDTVQKIIKDLGFVPIDANRQRKGDYTLFFTPRMIKVYEMDRPIIQFYKQRESIFFEKFIVDLIKDGEAVAIARLKKNVSTFSKTVKKILKSKELAKQ